REYVRSDGGKNRLQCRRFVWPRLGTLRDEQSKKHRDGQLHDEICSCRNRRSIRHESGAQHCRDRIAPFHSKTMAHVNGVVGSREMVKFGMIIDCTRQMLYINPNGASSAVSKSLASFLTGHGFTKIPMRLNGNNHFVVEGALNGQATRFIVDTGSATTLIDTQVAVKSGTGVTALASYGAGGAGNLVEGVNRTGVKEMAIGNFKLANAEVVVAHVSGDILLSKSTAESNAGVLGQDYLATNFAVIDMGGKTLYLRRPDSR